MVLIFLLLYLSETVLPCVTNCTGMSAGLYHSCQCCDAYSECGPDGTLYPDRQCAFSNPPLEFNFREQVCDHIGTCDVFNGIFK